MIDIALANKLGLYSKDVVQAAIRLWAIRNLYERKESEKVLISGGWERIDVESWQKVTADGRVIIRPHGDAWALKPEVHEAFMKKIAADAPIQKEQKSEGIAAVRCPQLKDGTVCGSFLNESSVCSGCSNVSAGFRYRYTCESCGFDIVTKEKLT